MILSIYSNVPQSNITNVILTLGQKTWAANGAGSTFFETTVINYDSPD